MGLVHSVLNKVFSGVKDEGWLNEVCVERRFGLRRVSRIGDVVINL